MLDKIGIVHGCITTVHNVTNTQTIVDAPNTKKADLRRARYGFHSIPLHLASGPMSYCSVIRSAVWVMACVLNLGSAMQAKLWDF